MVHVLRLRLYFTYVFWMHSRFLSATLLGQMQNVALNKATHQVSTHQLHGGVSSRAVDGNRDQYWNGDSCIYTDSEINPFWQVDLGDVYVVDTIRIYNRLDAGSDYTSNIQTAVSFDGNDFTPVCYHEGQIPDVYTCEPGTRVIGRWVKITSLRDVLYPMNFCEVEVMSDQTIARDLFRSIPFIRGTGSVLETKQVLSKMQCLYCCRIDINCGGANVLNWNNNATTEAVDSPDMECELLGHVINAETITNNTALWLLDIIENHSYFL